MVRMTQMPLFNMLNFQCFNQFTSSNRLDPKSILSPLLGLGLCLGLFGIAGVAKADDLLKSQQFLQTSEILPVDDAFVLSVTRKNDSLSLDWKITAGYYLYKHRLSVRAQPGIGELRMKPGIKKHDEIFGEVEVYYDFLEVSTTLLSPEGEIADVFVEYQGCADAGICYPPVKRAFSL